MVSIFLSYEIISKMFDYLGKKNAKACATCEVYFEMRKYQLHVFVDEEFLFTENLMQQVTCMT